ncbi:MAG: hypothetical protein KKH29_02345 [Candidatus Omnitrophica bacterium]|nr:hypothetical protein [Candidatus Omnitrophota bacterium]MBU4473599.1 hypothetical protein [Candidatus Omnitrophota bacterium]MCG2706316.1 hypothetical protein [Candidatus Omnitrophota bacterium]
MKLKTQNSCLSGRQAKLKTLLLVTSYLLLVTTLGCDAFVRKFTRKPKKENLSLEEMVFEPKEYERPQMTKEELYRHHFLYWKSWQDELIQVLSYNAVHKKQIDCVNEAIGNLEQLRSLLNEERQKDLDIYLNQLKGLKGLIKKDIYGSNIAGNRLAAERIKRNILRDFSYRKISEDISYEASD